MKALTAAIITFGILLGVCAGVYIWPALSPKQSVGSKSLISSNEAILPFPLSFQGRITAVTAETFTLSTPNKAVRIQYDKDTAALVRDPNILDSTFIEARLLTAPQEDIIKVGREVRADLWITGETATPYALMIVQSPFQ